MKTVTAEEMRLLERRMADELGVAAGTLMDRAGFGIASFVRRLLERKQISGGSVLLIAGTGNNGGDVFAASIYLKDAGVNPCVLLCGDREKVREPALQYLRELESSGIDVEQMNEAADWTDPENDYIYSLFPVIVDGILGTGLNGPAREPAASAIAFINRMARKARVVSVDLPSGMDSDRGGAEGPVVRADFTLAAGYPKRGFLAKSAPAAVGSMRLIDIGMPAHFLNDIKDSREVITDADLTAVLGRRQAESHKGTYGHLLVVAGARGYSGAAAMAAIAALRAGSGLVTVLSPESVVQQIASCVPEAMVHPVRETRAGAMSYRGFRDWSARLKEFSAVLAGPGMTASSDTLDIVKSILGSAEIPVLLDADALNVLAGRLDIVRGSKASVVLTPHPGEAARLIGISVPEIQSDRAAAAVKLAASAGAAAVLKGCGTIVADAEGRTRLSLSGNPGMATGGSGDVLAGLIAGLLAQNIEPYSAASAGVHLHGLAGDLAALSLSEAGITAGDISAAAPSVIGSVCGR